MNQISSIQKQHKGEQTMKDLTNNNQSPIRNFGTLLLPILFVSLLSVSCGSSSGGGGIGSESEGSDDKGITGISKGTITSTGGLTVNGVTFKTENTQFTVDDNPGTEDDLAIGMVVKVQGTIDTNGTTGIATEVEFESEVKGPISQINLTGNSLTVLGQTVIVDDSTIITDTIDTALSLADLGENELLEVSGLRFEDNRIQATRIKRETEVFIDDATEVELKGKIQALNTTGKTFSLGDQRIDYNGAGLIFEGISLSDIAEGLMVEVEGTRNDTGVLNATKIQKEDETFDALENETLELEGLVSNFTSSASFSINGQTVETKDNTLFENGTVSDLEANIRLEVEGVLNASRVLIATKVQFRGNRIKIEATIENIDQLANTVTLLGQTILLNASTEMEDDSSANDLDLTLSELSVGERLEIRAYLSDNVITATHIEREDAKSTVILQAPIDLLADPDLSLLGINIKTSGAIFSDLADNTISIGDFFPQVQVGSLVKVKGAFSSGEMIAEEVGLED